MNILSSYFDELGAGTDPTEGAALAIAILTSLHRRGIRTMATTHYSELKVFALTTEGVENASCEFDVETLRPTYHLLIGIPGKSNAFAISKKLGLSDEIIEEAKTHLSDQEESFEELLSDLEHSRRTIEREQAEIRAYKEELETLRRRTRKSRKNSTPKRNGSFGMPTKRQSGSCKAPKIMRMRLCGISANSGKKIFLPLKWKRSGKSSGREWRRPLPRSHWKRHSRRKPTSRPTLSLGLLSGC